MIGQIESYDPDTQTGVIKSEDKFFSFHIDAWQNPASPEAGDHVNFVEQDTAASFVELAGAYLAKPKAVKYRYLAALLSFLFGFIGGARLYLGFYRTALLQLLLTPVLLFTGFIVFTPLWGLVEAVLLAGGHINQDAKGRPLK